MVGWALACLSKAFLPQVKLISYMEWYFTKSNSEPIVLAEIRLDDQLRLETRNLPLLQEMVQADQIVCPTEWQRQQFPGHLFGIAFASFLMGWIKSSFAQTSPANPLILGQQQ